MHSKSHYDILHISKNAKPEAITAAYQALVQKCRDELRPNADASKYLNAIGDAHAVLSDPEQRAAYDLWLQEQELAKTGAKQPSPPINTPPAVDSRSVKQNKSPVSPPEHPAPESAATPRKLRLSVAALLVIILAGLFWFNAARNTTAQPESQVLKAAGTEENAVAPLPGAQVQDEDKATEVTEIAIPDHDRVALENYIGNWQGSGDTPEKWQKLDIQKKSATGIVFQLDSKAPGEIGEVYGIAEFRNGYALFFNQEYGCSIVFSIKSGTMNVNTSGCQAFHGSGTRFDGSYVRPGMAKSTAAPRTVTASKAPKPLSAPAPANSAASVSVPDPPAANPGKLYRFVATVKNADGKTERIELVAANEAAARAILRDFRGNPTVVRIRKAWF